jgi:MGT family glycosyltransferase
MDAFMEKNIEEKLKGKNILFATFPADGHFNPLTSLAKYLQEAGCDVRWYTSPIYKQRLERLNIMHYSFSKTIDINPGNVDEMFPERKLITDLGERANFDYVNTLCKMAPGNLEDIQLIQESFPFDMIITDNVLPSIPLLKVRLNVPVIAIGIMPLAEESRDLGPYGPGFHPPKNSEELKVYNELKELFNNVVFKEAIDTYSAILEKNHIQYQKEPITHTLIRHASLYLQIGTPSFEYERSDLGQNIRFIGALLPYTNLTQSEDHRWFDERLKKYKKIVLVTQGTVERDTTKILEPTLQAFQNTDTLVIATTGGYSTQELKEKYPHDNLIIEDYIPFNDVMPYATVYVTNGGYSGALLSISNQLPMVTAGVHEGKSEICSRVGYFKCGVDLKTETPTAEAIKDAVNLVLTDSVYKQNVIKLSAEMNSYNAKELAAQYIAEELNKSIPIKKKRKS